MAEGRRNSRHRNTLAPSCSQLGRARRCSDRCSASSPADHRCPPPDMYLPRHRGCNRLPRRTGSSRLLRINRTQCSTHRYGSPGHNQCYQSSALLLRRSCHNCRSYSDRSAYRRTNPRSSFVRSHRCSHRCRSCSDPSEGPSTTTHNIARHCCTSSHTGAFPGHRFRTPNRKLYSLMCKRRVKGSKPPPPYTKFLVYSQPSDRT